MLASCFPWGPGTSIRIAPFIALRMTVVSIPRSLRETFSLALAKICAYVMSPDLLVIVTTAGLISFRPGLAASTGTPLVLARRCRDPVAASLEVELYIRRLFPVTFTHSAFLREGWEGGTSCLFSTNLMPLLYGLVNSAVFTIDFLSRVTLVLVLVYILE